MLSMKLLRQHKEQSQHDAAPVPTQAEQTAPGRRTLSLEKAFELHKMGWPPDPLGDRENRWLQDHREPGSMRPSSPCIAICSTSQGDDVCKGCGRTFQEVCLWLEMDEPAKDAAWVRIETERTALRYTRYQERAR